MKYNEILLKLKHNDINCEQALEYLAQIGHCPNLLNDDNGHWAITFDGFQNARTSDEPQDISTTCFIEAKDWKDTIHEALIWSLEKED